MTLVVTVLSPMVVVFASLESVLHYREQWKNDRSKEQLLGREALQYRTRITPYANLDDAAAFKRQFSMK